MSARKVVTIGQNGSYDLIEFSQPRPMVKVVFESAETTYSIAFDSQKLLETKSREFFTNETVVLDTTEANGVAFVCDLGMYYHYKRQLFFTAFFQPDTMRIFLEELFEAATSSIRENTLQNFDMTQDFFADV